MRDAQLILQLSPNIALNGMNLDQFVNCSRYWAQQPQQPVVVSLTEKQHKCKTRSKIKAAPSVSQFNSKIKI